MELTLTLVFGCTDGSKSTLNIENIKSGLTQEEVNSLMDTIIAKNIFVNKHGEYISKSGASITSKEVTKYDIA